MRFFLFLVLNINIIFAQTDSVFKGVLKVDNEYLEGISITNLNTKNAVISGYKGGFNIVANSKDTLFFNGLNINSKKIIINKRNLTSSENIIKLQFKEQNIESVLVKNSSTWAKNLGIAPKDNHKYTKEERAVKAAVESNLIITPISISGSLDPLINKLTGRTKQLKKDLAIANKVILQDKITNIISKDNITKLHNIPIEYVDGFLFYVAEDANLEKLMLEKNYNEALFKIGKLAIEYKILKKLIPLENKTNTNETISK